MTSKKLANPPIWALLTLACAGLMCASQASAAPTTSAVTLASLIDSGGTLQSGDKLFSNFGYVSTGSGFPAATDIQVQGEQVGANYGLDFVSGWHANPGQGLQTAKISYTVSVVDRPGYYISDIHLDGDPTLIGDAGQALVKLSASDLSHTTVLPPGSVLQVYDAVGVPAVVNAFANTVGTPANLRSLSIETTILGSADAMNANASVLHIQESFSQAPVPEPSTNAMALVGLSVLGFMARRKRQAAQRDGC